MTAAMPMTSTRYQCKDDTDTAALRTATMTSSSNKDCNDYQVLTAAMMMVTMI